MGLTKIGPNHQIALPRDAVDALHLSVGDILEGRVHEGKLVLVLKKRARTSVPALSPHERKLLARAQRKIERIRRDPSCARGLTREEADLSARAGLIDRDQRWWWTEEWQRGEREAECDIRAGRTKAFRSAKELLADLREQ